MVIIHKLNLVSVFSENWMNLLGIYIDNKSERLRSESSVFLCK